MYLFTSIYTPTLINVISSRGYTYSCPRHCNNTALFLSLSNLSRTAFTSVCMLYKSGGHSRIKFSNPFREIYQCCTYSRTRLIHTANARKNRANYPSMRTIQAYLMLSNITLQKVVSRIIMQIIWGVQISEGQIIRAILYRISFVKSFSLG